MYKLPYDPCRPQVCMDEMSRQLIGEVRKPLSPEPGKPVRHDHEYFRNGTANIFMIFEPLTGKTNVDVTERRTKIDWAHLIRKLVDEYYPDAEKIVLVMDNLNTHSKASLYEAFEPEDAKRIADKLEIHFTPKHGSWLNIAECILSVLSSQCLDRRIPCFDDLNHQVKIWNKNRNQNLTPVDWRFTTDEARVKLKRLYPTIQN